MPSISHIGMLFNDKNKPIFRTVGSKKELKEEERELGECDHFLPVCDFV